MRRSPASPGRGGAGRSGATEFKEITHSWDAGFQTSEGNGGNGGKTDPNHALGCSRLSTGGCACVDDLDGSRGMAQKLQGASNIAPWEKIIKGEAKIDV